MLRNLKRNAKEGKYKRMKNGFKRSNLRLKRITQRINFFKRQENKEKRLSKLHISFKRFKLPNLF